MAKKKKPAKPLAAIEKTWWHPVFAAITAWLLEKVCRCEKEVSTGELPKSIDLVARRNRRKLTDWVLQAAPSVFSRLNDITLFELKGPTASLRNGDLALMLSRLGAWHAAEENKPTLSKVSILFVAPAMTSGFKDELKLWGMKAVENSPGIHRIEGMPVETWVIGTIEGEKRGEPLLSVMSPRFVEKRRAVVDKVATRGYGNILTFFTRELQHFSERNPSLPIPTFEIDDMAKFTKEMEKEMIEMLGAECVLEHISMEDRLKNVPVEEILTKDRLKGLSPQDLEQIRQLLDEQAEGNSGKN